ncbi:uncharacterized protein LOC122873373 isoform X9 [Siniperca chuatsi]|uniref:uncharacterized protein LOC122873373 isoform X9 n=1 Tax=Siniperca chuatsi TaxID=119488 RepID=UPI001CE14E1C|nr:uncharacterized protein LOC122873373 isoform X9 [Siniperca chuatsi]
MLGFCLTDTTDTYLSFGSLRSGSVWVCEDRVTEYEMRTTPSELKLLASVLGTCNAPKKSEDRTGLSLGVLTLELTAAVCFHPSCSSAAVRRHGATSWEHETQLQGNRRSPSANRGAAKASHSAGLYTALYWKSCRSIPMQDHLWLSRRRIFLSLPSKGSTRQDFVEPLCRRRHLHLQDNLV